MQFNQNHKFTLQGLTGVVVGFMLLLALFIIRYFVFNFALFNNVYQIPNLYYKLFFGFVCLLFCLVVYYSIIYINRYRATKYKWHLLPKNSKLIKVIFWITLLVSTIIGFYLIFNSKFEFLIPLALLIYGLFCITINKLTNGNSIILGLFFVLQSFLAVLFPEASFILALIAFGLFHIIYALLRKKLA